MNDPIADMIIRVKNAGAAGRDTVSFPYSKLKLTIAELLVKEGFAKSVSTKGKNLPKTIEMEVLYEAGAPRIRGVERVSRFSRRIYTKASAIQSVLSGLGVLVLSTPKGIMTGKQARKENVGGEALFKIW